MCGIHPFPLPPHSLLQIVQSSLSPLCLRVRRQPTFMPAPPCQYVHVTYTRVAWGEGRHCRQALNSCPNLILSHVFSTTFNHKSLYGRDLITNTDALRIYFTSMYEMFIFSGQFDSAVTSPSQVSISIVPLAKKAMLSTLWPHVFSRCLSVVTEVQ